LDTKGYCLFDWSYMAFFRIYFSSRMSDKHRRSICLLYFVAASNKCPVETSKDRKNLRNYLHMSKYLFKLLLRKF
jgi:hypothetical protein